MLTAHFAIQQVLMADYALSELYTVMAFAGLILQRPEPMTDATRMLVWNRSCRRDE